MGSQETQVDFGPKYAILHLDWTTLMCGAADNAPEGRLMMSNCMKWNDAIHSKAERPLTIFTTLAFRRGQHELVSDSAFGRLVSQFGSFEEGSPIVDIDPRFAKDDRDIFLQKTRWSATSGSNLEQILRAKEIKTVILVSFS